MNMLDFTCRRYRELIDIIKTMEFSFVTCNEYFASRKASDRVNIGMDTQIKDRKGYQGDYYLIFRHDVDRLPGNSLRFAEIQHHMKIRGSFYFRIVPKSFNEQIIQKIASLGHEIGYHYETMDTCRGNVDKAYDEFCRNLEKFRKIVPVTTICMHGSPRSKYDNRYIWKKYDYRSLGIIGEPYFDIDFNNVAYFTDTGRRWNGNQFSVRDKVESRYNFNFRTTQDIIDHIDQLPDQVMFTFHPQRWTDDPFLWVRELLLQSAKNVVKRYFFVSRK